MKSARKQRKASELDNLYRMDLDRHLYVWTFPGTQPSQARAKSQPEGSGLLEWIQSGWARWRAAAEAAYLL